MVDLPPQGPPAGRFLGWLFIVLGAALAAGAGYSAIYMAGEVGTPRWTGDQALTLAMFAVFAIVVVFGVLAILNGRWVLRHGVMSPSLRNMLLGAGLSLFALAAVVILTQGDV